MFPIILVILIVIVLLLLYVNYRKECFSNSEYPYIIDIGTGANHSVFLNKYGKVVSSGKNLNGRIGTGNTTSALIPVSPSGQRLPSVMRICVGNVNTFFIMADNTVYAIGENSNNQFGLGNQNNYLAPVKLDFFTGKNIRKVAAGWYHTIFCSSEGDVYVCGDNKYGQLANGTNENAKKPILLNGLKCWDIAAGLGHSVFVTTEGTLYTAGWNFYGQLGNCSDNNSNTPVLINTENLRVFFAYAGMNHTMYITGGKLDEKLEGEDEYGIVYACGDNSNGQLGIPRATTYQCTFTRVMIGNNERCFYVATGKSHTLFMTDRLQMYAVGLNLHGQLGLGHDNTIDKAEMIPFFKDMPVFKMEAGENHSVFLTMEGTVYATGDNTMRGQLAISDITKTNTPVKCDIPIESRPGETTYEMQVSGIDRRDKIKKISLVKY